MAHDQSINQSINQSVSQYSIVPFHEWIRGT